MLGLQRVRGWPGIPKVNPLSRDTSRSFSEPAPERKWSRTFQLDRSLIVNVDQPGAGVSGGSHLNSV